MAPFLILISQLVFIALLQSIVEHVLEIKEKTQYQKLVNMACLGASYGLLIRYVHSHLWPGLSALANITL